MDSVNATVLDNFILDLNGGGTTLGSVGSPKMWTAGAGDVGVVRKAKVYVTHPTNGTVVTCQNNILQVATH